MAEVTFQQPRRLFLGLFIVFAVLQSLCSGSSHHHSAPSLSITEDRITKNSGDTLEITCYSHAGIEWKYPELSNNDINLRLTMVTTERRDINGQKQYTSVLTVVNTTYQDTGRYRCELKNSRDYLPENETSADVYVFIKSDKSRELFLPVGQMSHKIFAEWSFAIPCRVSDPDAVVTLVNSKGRVMVDGDAVRYDPARGFIVKNGGSPEYDGICSCKAQWNGVQESVLYILIYEATAPIPEPRIERSKPEVVQGEPFRMMCTVDAPLSVTMMFEWAYPGQQNSNNVDITQTSARIEEETKTYRRFYSDLKVRDATFVNEGYYNCTAINYKGRNTASSHVTVLETGYLHIQPKDYVVTEVKGTENAKIVFTVNAYPKASYEWFKDGEQITSRNSTFTLRKNENQRKLVIDEVTNEHRGNYSLVGSNEYGMYVEETVQLIVVEPPQITIKQTPLPTETNPPLFMQNGTYRLDCEASGQPVPMVTWEWNPCIDEDDCKKPFSNFNQWSAIPDNPDTPSLPGFHYVQNTKPGKSSLHVRAAVQAGWYRCNALSPYFRNTSQDVEFKLTDVENGLHISAEPTPAVETIPVNITCQANKYVYRNIEWSRVVDGNNTEYFPQDLTSDIIINNTESEHTHISTLMLLSPRIDDSAKYECMVTKRREQDKDKPEQNAMATLSYDLNVNVISKPVIVKHLKKLRVLASKGSFSLECQASSLLQPVFTWYKDGVQIENNDISEVEGSIVTSTLTIQRITMYDTGVYKCTATNRGGAISSTAHIDIWVEPRVAVQPKDTYAQENENVTLQCVVSGNPLPVVEWGKRVNATYIMPVSKKLYKSLPSQKFSVTSNIHLIHMTATEMGKYRCFATNMLETRWDDGSITIAPTFVGQQKASNAPLSDRQIRMLAMLGGAIAVALVVFIIVIITLRRYRRRTIYRHGDIKEMSFPPIIEDGIDGGIEEACEKIPYDEAWEFPKERMRIGQTIGKGAFGKVAKAAAWGVSGSNGVTTVAVKMLKEDASESETRALWMELKMLIHIGQHLNIVNLLGACTTDCLYLIMEFCKYGNLCEYLRTRRDSFVLEPNGTPSTSPSSDQDNYDDVFEYKEYPLSLHDLTCFGFQVARGMEFLTSKRVIHRDLAARNVLVADNNVVKICDFGLSRDVYDDPNYVTKGSCRLPIKWMAPESIMDDKVFTTQSDVWSFGILIWEIFSLGATPYPGLQIDEHFFEKVRSGYKMRCPELAPQEIYQVMCDCWSLVPKMRPTFHQLADMLGGFLENTTRQEYIDLNDEYEKRSSRAFAYADLMNEETQEYQPLMLNSKTGGLSKSGSSSEMRESRLYLEPITRKVNGSAVTTFPASENDGEYDDNATEGHPLRQNTDSFNKKGSTQSEESVSSDLSSGFHSEGGTTELRSPHATESEPPPEYNKVMEAETQFRNSVRLV